MAKAVTPEETQALIALGQTYVDVRTEQEFEAGHPTGAFNVPLSNMGMGGFEPNAEFMSVMERAFPKDTELVIGCKTGSRSRRAAAMLAAVGFTKLSDMVAGYAGSRDAFGRPSPGWTQKGLPTETGAPEGRRYADLRNR